MGSGTTDAGRDVSDQGGCTPDSFSAVLQEAEIPLRRPDHSLPRPEEAPTRPVQAPTGADAPPRPSGTSPTVHEKPRCSPNV